MEIKSIQHYLEQSGSKMKKPFGSTPEIMMAIVEELGEVAQEISLIEQIGSKAEWQKQPSKERLAEEMTHLLNVILTLANFYEIDLDEIYSKQLNKE
jgi:NTP pyrophosphatase (non-canonical NTP hydrolase)